MEPSDFKFVSENTLDMLSLHDCTIERSSFINGILKLEMDFINVLPEHPQNEYPVAKCTNEALLVFENVEIIESFVYGRRKVNHNSYVADKSLGVSYSIDVLAMNFEILQVTFHEYENLLFTYTFFGDANSINHGFAEFTIRFSRCLVCWNEFSGDAWFVNWK